MKSARSRRISGEKLLRCRTLSFLSLTAIAAGAVLSCSRTNDEDVDVHGNGLTRRAERILGVDVAAPSNPLVLIPVTTGEEPFTLTYKVPIQPNFRSNRCQLVLLDNGKPADAYLFTRQTNGGYLLDWTTTSARFGPHTLQVEMRIPFHTNVHGPTREENVTNLVQFERGTASFGTRVWIHGFLHVPSADYRIEISGTNQVLLKTIVGHTEKGVIDEVWDLRTPKKEVLGDREFDAQVYITPTVKDPNGVIKSNAPTVRVPYP